MMKNEKEEKKEKPNENEIEKKDEINFLKLNYWEVAQ